MQKLKALLKWLIHPLKIIVFYCNFPERTKKNIMNGFGALLSPRASAAYPSPPTCSQVHHSEATTLGHTRTTIVERKVLLMLLQYQRPSENNPLSQEIGKTTPIKRVNFSKIKHLGRNLAEFFLERREGLIVLEVKRSAYAWKKNISGGQGGSEERRVQSSLRCGIMGWKVEKLGRGHMKGNPICMYIVYERKGQVQAWPGEPKTVRRTSRDELWHRFYPPL